ncbi:MAG: hypothetical protein U0797_30355 [Gemmataceae bacterium]
MSEPTELRQRLPKRGRPSLFYPTEEEFLGRLYPDVKSRRGRQEVKYMLSAIIALVENRRLFDERVRWVYCPEESAKGAKEFFRPTVLAELGRFPGRRDDPPGPPSWLVRQDDGPVGRRWGCCKPGTPGRPHGGRGWTSSSNRGIGRRPGSCALNEFLARHPDTCVAAGAWMAFESITFNGVPVVEPGADD